MYIYLRFLMALLALMFSQMAYGVLPVPNPRVCAQFYNSDLVAIVEVQSSQIVFEEGLGGEEVYQIKIKEIFRGDAKGEFEIRTGLHSARGSLEVGTTSLIFAVRHKSELDGKKALFIYGSGHSGTLRKNDERLRKIHSLLQERKDTANVRGYVYPHPIPIPENAIFLASSEEHVFETKIDQEGWFNFELPPGTYDIAPKDDEKIMIYDLSYNYPMQLKVQADRCYEVAFRGRY